MGFRQRNSPFLALLGLGSIIGVNSFWFGAMKERAAENRALEPRQFVQCSTGSTACGDVGCVGTRRCCNAGAGWACLAGNACYTASGYVDCYSTTMVMPTLTRQCYDFGATGCGGGQACFRCQSTARLCATEVLAGGANTWLECYTKSTVWTVTATAQIQGTTTTSSGGGLITTPPTSTTSLSSTTSTSSSTLPPSPTPGPTLGGGAIAGIAIGGLAGIAIVGALLFFFCRKNPRNPNGAVAGQQQYPPQQQMQFQPQQMQAQMGMPQPPYSPPPQQNYATLPPQPPQPPYSPLPGYQGQVQHNGYGPDGQPVASPAPSPAYPEQPKQPIQMPVELGSNH